jgi:hypothetical protein
MKLDECLSLPEMEGTYLKFIGECPNQGVSTSPWLIIFIVFPVIVALVGLGLWIAKRRRDNETESWFSGSSTSTPVSDSDGGYDAPEYAKL